MSTKMETTFYDDSLNTGFSQHDAVGYGYSRKALKENMTLNLSDPAATLKPHLRPKASDLLTSPDVGLLKLASPELERLIIQSSNGLITTTPTPTQFLCPKNVTDEQEGFAEGFVRALAELHHQHMPNGVNVAAAAQTSSIAGDLTAASSMAGSTPYSCTIMRSEPPEYTDLTTFNQTMTTAAAVTYSSANLTLSYSVAQSQHQHQPQSQHQSQPQPQHHMSSQLSVQHPRLQALKEEPQTVPEMPGETPPLSPIDMETQERIKAERKRMR
ncbi:transcription factor AP-1-like, partial [Scleropages formosus]